MLSHEDDPSSSNTTECESRGAYNQHLGSAAATEAAALASIYSPLSLIQSFQNHLIEHSDPFSRGLSVALGGTVVLLGSSFHYYINSL